MPPVRRMSTEALGQRRAGVDRFYSNLSIGIAPQSGLIGDQVLPILYTELSRELIAKFGDEAFRLVEDKVGDYSVPKKIDTALDKLAVEVDGHALESPISDRHQKESLSGPAQLDLEERNIYVLKQKMLLNREKEQAALVMNDSLYAGTHVTDATMAPWDTETGGVSDNDPYDALMPLIEDVIPGDAGERPNTLVSGLHGYLTIANNTKMRDRCFGSLTTGPRPGMPTPAQIATAIGIDKFLVGRAIYRTGTQASPTINRIWGDKFALVYVPPTAGAEIPAFGYTVEQRVFGQASEYVTRIRNENMGASGGWDLKRSHFYTPAMTFPAAGAIVINAFTPF